MANWWQQRLNPLYAIQLNDSGGVVRGIVRFQLVTAREALKNVPVRFSLSLKGRQGSVDVTREVVPANVEASWIGVHSHLLEDGPYTVEWAANDWHGRCRIVISNPGPLAADIRDSLERQKVNIFLIEPCDAGFYRHDSPDLVPWFDRDDCQNHLDMMLREKCIPSHLEMPFRQFLSEGWLEIENHVEPRLLKQLNADMRDAAARGDSGFSPGSSQRLELLHLKYKSFWQLVNYGPTQTLIDHLMQLPTEVCQVLGFVNGSQQDPHQDSVHLTAFPQGYMCGAWLALEDVQPDSGELVVFPGSHRWPAILMNHFEISKVKAEDWSDFGGTVVQRWGEMLHESASQPLIYRPKAGSLLIWHDRLMHGGLPRHDPSLTRRSCVSHHFAQGALCFHDSTGLPGKLIYRGSRGPGAWERARWRKW